MRRGLSLIGLLVTLVIIVVLFSIIMSSMKGAVGGGGGAGGVQQNQVSTHADRMNLDSIYKGMAYANMSIGGRLPTPSVASETRDKSLDTTANFYSLLIARNMVRPEQLISENEQSDFVWADEDYNYNASYQPVNGVFWDRNFKADLTSDSNVSFAHLVMLGERHRQHWAPGGSSLMPILGNRGPEGGVPAPESWHYPSWAGNMVFADGHIEFLSTPAVQGMSGSDNVFGLEAGYTGGDAIITFTKEIWESGFEMQFD